jgi:hypothetical protein
VAQAFRILDPFRVACVPVTTRRLRSVVSTQAQLSRTHIVCTQTSLAAFFPRTPSGERLSPFEGVPAAFDRVYLIEPA